MKLGKIFKAALLVGAAVLVAVAVPYAAPFISSALGVSAAIGTAIASTLIGMGVSLAMSAVMGAFRKAPNLSSSLADRLNATVNPTAPRKIVFGTTAAGNDVRFQQQGEGSGLTKALKERYFRVTALASHRVHAIKQIYLENELVWSGGSTVASAFDGGVLSVNAITEGSSGNAFSMLGTLWTADAKFTGCAYHAINYKLDNKIFPSGLPQRVTTVVDGCPVYDPRLDGSTGGSGAHRATDQSTWAFYNGSTAIGRNPALALLTYLIGWRVGGKLMWGMGVPLDAIDLPNFRAYANLCEETVTTVGGGSVQRYTADGIFSTADTHESITGALTAAMGSTKLVDVGGLYQLIGGFDDTAGPRFSFNEGDLIGSYEYRPAPPLRERFNVARGRFADPANLYQLNDWGAVESDALADDIERPLQLDFACVSRHETAQRIAKQFLQREAFAGVFAATFGPRAFAVQVGSLVELSLPTQGWNAKLFRVIDQTETHDLLFQMTLREESALIYSWDEEETDLVPSVLPPGYDPKATLPVEGLAISPRVVTGSDGNGVAWLDISWTPETSGRVQGIEIQTQEAGGVDWTPAVEGLFNASVGGLSLRAPTGGITVNARARYRMVTGFVGDWATTSAVTPATPVAWPNLSSRPTELTDGRIPLSLNADGTIRPGKVLASSIADYVLNITKFEPGYEPPYSGTSLPNPSGYVGPELFFNKTDKKLYRYASGAWTAAVPAVDVTGQLTNAQLADIAAAKITGTLSDAQLAAISAAKVTGTLSDAQLSAISAAKVTGTLSDAQLAAISAAKVTGQIINTQIADGSITTAKLVANSVTSNEIAAGTIVGGDIAGSTITGGNIAGSTITGGNIAAGTIVAGNIAASTITGGNIAGSTITGGNIAAGTIVAGNIAASTITGTQISAGAISAGHIVSATITTSQIAASTITGGNIAGSTITGGNIAANTITGGHIVANTIDAGHLKAGIVTADKIQSRSLTADRFAAGTITGYELAASNIITASAQINDGTITNAKITGAIYSDNWTGVGGTGWYIGKAGDAYFNGVVISRDNVVAASSANFGFVDIVNIPAFGELYDASTYAVRDDLYIDTGISVAAWYDSTGPLSANARISGSYPPAVDGTYYNDSKWAVSCEVIPLVRYAGAATVFLKIRLYGQHVEYFSPLYVDWIVYKVT